MRQALDTENQSASCSRAGPGGGGWCGALCDTYCAVFPLVCGAFCNKHPDNCTGMDADCQRRCIGLHVKGATQDLSGGPYNKDEFSSGDSLQCRIRYLVDAVSTPDPYCGYAAFNPTGKCSDPDEQLPRCEDFCKLTVSAACVDALSVYESDTQCRAVCGAMVRAGKQGTDGD